MSDDISRGKLCEDLNRESLQLNQHLEKMTEDMENISGIQTPKSVSHIVKKVRFQ